jgi:hypothetical protein
MFPICAGIFSLESNMLDPINGNDAIKIIFSIDFH